MKKKDYKLFRLITSIVVIVVLVIGILIATDVILVSKYNKNPIFVIKVKEYKDGGSKEYLGIGYKVIKYNQPEGRRDMKVGFWNLKYTVEPTEMDTIDFAIEFVDNPKKTIDKYYGKFLKINGRVSSLNIGKKIITLSYLDPDKKYTQEFICEYIGKKEKMIELKNGDDISIKGNAYQFNVKKDDMPNSIKINNCFVE